MKKYIMRMNPWGDKSSIGSEVEEQVKVGSPNVSLFNIGEDEYLLLEEKDKKDK